MALKGPFLLFAKTTGFSLLGGAQPVCMKWPSCSLYIVIILPSEQSITMEPCDMLNTGVGKPSFEVSVFLVLVFRWFKFTLKPPYSIACDKLRLAIWDTSICTFLLKFGYKGP